MCGLVGALRTDGSNTDRDLAGDLAVLAHRGPDASDSWREGPVVLGHRRLSIIDLDPRGMQPFHSSCGRWHMVFNGEIYNYLEIKKRLEGCGVLFRTDTDTEVLIELIAREGLSALHECNGMWSFALWDSVHRELVLCRDRYGIKPMFVRRQGNELRFASEPKALLDVGERPEVNRARLYHFLDRNEGADNTLTVYRDIERLPPGHLLRSRMGEQTVEAWYQLEPTAGVTELCPDDRREQFRELVIDACRLRLRADVPVGVCLSGGVDSSVVTAILAGICATPVKTFSSIHQQEGYSEELFIDDVVARYKTNAYKLTPLAEDFSRVLKNLVRAHDRPVRMPGTYSHWHVMQCASDHVTVLLDGQGADELLGGYRYYYPPAQEGWVRRLMRGQFETAGYLRESFKGLQKHVAHGGWGRALGSRLYRSLVPRQLDAPRWQDLVCSTDFIDEGRDWNPPNVEHRFDEPLDQALWASFSADNLPMLLDFEDRISMAFSLEARVPFLDPRVVEFCFALPPDDKIRGYTNKYLLREAFGDLLPESVRTRKDKLGFPTPTEHWFRNELQGEVGDRLTDPSQDRHGFFDRQKTEKIWQEHLAGAVNHERLIWRMLSVGQWCTDYLDQPCRTR